MTGTGIPGLSPLTKHNPASGRILVTKGGVSLGVSDSSARHSYDMTAWEEGPDPGPCLVYYAVIVYIV